MSGPLPDDPPDFLSREALLQHYAEVRTRLRTGTARTNIVPLAVPRPARAAPPPAQAQAAAAVPVVVPSPLDPRHNLAQFCIGDSNRMAHAAALALIQRPETARAYTPLYLHSAAGLGKTHLLHAIAAQAGVSALYLTAEAFQSGYLAALAARQGDVYRDRLRAVDMLLIDDVQLIPAAMARLALGNALNSMVDAGKHVVLSANVPPDELEGYDSWQRSRISSGLVLEILPPEAELRHAILAQSCAARGAVHQVRPEVLSFIAGQPGLSGRDLEAVLNRVLLHAEMTGAPLALDDADAMLGTLLRAREPRRVRIDDILRVVAKHYSVTRADLMSQRRTATVVLPRQVAMYLAKTLTLRSLPEIGRRFGGRDHTTVLHAVRKIAGLVASDAALDAELRGLAADLREGGA
ncbi:chromosomal replication initiator protein DnaA [Ancylobacter sp. VNQ12]|uniref:chromosomal replication initiator protein DnaA n=1 Tax=Ancylobacter sp. VNQ12 TaxID=3400920 RepID=UPI003C078B37